MINTLIAIFLSIFSFRPELAWLKTFGTHFIFAHCIGHSIYFLACFSNFEQITSRWIRLLALVGIFLLGGWIGTFIGVGLNKLFWGFKVSADYFKTFFIAITVFNLFIASIVYSYFVLRGRLQDTAAKLAQKEIDEQRILQLKAKAELDALHAKVNPHFLFNTLNSIASLIPVNPQKAEDMVQKLSHLFRYTLDAGGHRLMKLQDEIKIIEDYLEIEKVRLGDRLTYQIDVDKQLDDFKIPGLLLQPLVENSVKHGISPKKKVGKINVTCSKRDGFCVISVRDTGDGFVKRAEKSNGFGLSGVRERLELFYGDRHDFKITNDSGTCIEIRLPFMTNDEST
ncbi:hypothetical protein GWN42_22695 [candidate division KSB1 bacterium]|nr:hypothetical protein [candidate division KSB1 bacterium]NIS23926.1 hypothetical protein [candidate division KSB1 bacterium]NIU24574.1 hypothetical protein [candidate division KSB1 bacterium]NIU94557.1 hypothetical protein [candidate division KSB1 bacterium]NIV95520.1 hypothetical protein [candidate division KSB1 bacterium]